MRFTSKYAGLQVPVIDEQVQWTADGRKIVKRPHVYVDFGETAYFGEEVLVSDLDGEKSPIAEIRGGIYDTEEAAKAHGWTDEEKVEVERRLLQLCPNNPNPDPYDRRIIGHGDIELYEAPKPVLPWPKYDEAPAANVAKMADAFGCVVEALIYEQRTHKREKVLEALQALIDQQQVAAEAEELSAV